MKASILPCIFGLLLLCPLYLHGTTPPSILVEPHPQEMIASVGSVATLTVEASGQELSYRWQKDGKVGFRIKELPNAEDLIQNGDFTGDFNWRGVASEWEVFGARSWTASTAEGSQDGTAQQISYGSDYGWGPMLAQAPPIEHGKSYRLTVRYKTEVGATVLLSVANLPFQSWSRLLRSPISSGGEWKEESWVFGADYSLIDAEAAQHNTIYIRIENLETNLTGSFWVDHVSLVEVEDLATGSTLVLDPVQEEDFGMYRVLVSNPWGSVFSDDVVLSKPEMNLNTTALSMPYTAASGNISVTGNVEWTATPSVDWITITGGATGNSSGMVSLSVPANTSIEDRSGQITVASAAHGVERVVTVMQSGAPPQIVLSPEEITPAHSGGSGSISVTSNVSWSVSASDAWISITSGNSGNGSGMIEYTVTPNLQIGFPREGSITVSSPEHNLSQNVTVGQPPEVHPVTFTITGLQRTYDGNPKAVQVSSHPEGVPYQITYEGNSTAPVSPGYYHVIVWSDSPWFEGQASALFHIAPPSLYAFSPMVHDLGDGYKYHIHLGWLWDSLAPFVYYWDLGWVYTIGNDESSYYLWDFTHGRMLQTGSSVYPHLMIVIGNESGEWIVWPGVE